MALVAGVDCSTQATKVLIVETDSGEILAQGRAGHEGRGIDGARETDPLVWWDALRAALAQTGMARDVEAISIGAQQHGLVLVDEQANPLRPAILWNDVRSAPQSERLITALGGSAAAAALLGSVPVAAFTVTSWMWLRDHEPEVVSRTRGVRLPHDWLNERLTGTATTDRGDVSATGWWSSTTDVYVPAVLELPDVRLDGSLLPQVLGPTQSAGVLSVAAAQDLGLRAGIPVGAGTGDNPAAALALGLEPGELVLSLGTSGTVYTVSVHSSADASGTVVGLADANGNYLPLACTLNCTQAVDRIAALLGIDREEVAPANDVVVMPFLDGERTPNLPYSSGLISGVRHSTTPEQILMAAYEGAIFSLLEAAELVSGVELAASDAPLIVIGGGARGAAWRQAVARLSGRPVSIPAHVELVALGAAVQATAVLATESLLSVAKRWNTRAGVEEPAQPRDEERMSLLREVERAATLLDTEARNRHTKPS